MKKNEFMNILNTRNEKLIKTLNDKGFGDSSMFVKILADDVLTIGVLEKLVENEGFVTKREKYKANPYTFYSTILDTKGETIGTIDNQGLPSIMLYKSDYQIDLATKLSESDQIIEPIKGVHRVLDWHETDGKFHILANEEIVLNSLPVQIPTEKLEDFLEKTKITPNSFTKK